MHCGESSCFFSSPALPRPAPGTHLVQARRWRWRALLPFHLPQPGRIPAHPVLNPRNCPWHHFSRWPADGGPVRRLADPARCSVGPWNSKRRRLEKLGFVPASVSRIGWAPAHRTATVPDSRKTALGAAPQAATWITAVAGSDVLSGPSGEQCRLAVWEGVERRMGSSSLTCVSNAAEVNLTPVLPTHLEQPFRFPFNVRREPLTLLHRTHLCEDCPRLFGSDKSGMAQPDPSDRSKLH